MAHVNWVPKLGEPGYWNDRLREAKTEAEFIHAYVEHKKELESHGGRLRPYDVLVSRLLGRFGQYGGFGQKADDDPRREDAIWLLQEVHRYLALTSVGMVDGISVASAVRKRTVAELEADIACAGSSLKGHERSHAEVYEVFPIAHGTPDSRKFAQAVDTGCTGDGEHESAPCRKCAKIRESAAKAIDTAMMAKAVLEAAARNADNVMIFCGSDMPDHKKVMAERKKKGAAAKKKLERQDNDLKKALDPAFVKKVVMSAKKTKKDHERIHEDHDEDNWKKAPR